MSRRTPYAVFAPLALAGCIELKPADPAAPMCRIDEECDTGEVCGSDGICYGNPPALRLGAELFPPAALGMELARSDLGEIGISPDGTIENLTFLPSVRVAGRVVLAGEPDLSVSARIVFRRASRIPGGPDYVVTAQAQPGKRPGETGFVARLVPNDPQDPDDLYEVSIYPDDTPSSDLIAPSPAELAPPRRDFVAIHADHDDMTLLLGEEDGMKEIRGRVLDAVSKGVPGLIVRAYGTFQPGARRELASSLGRTDLQGWFSIRVPIKWQDTFDLVVAPAKGGEPFPSVVRTGVLVPDPVTWPTTEATTIPDIRLPAFPTPVTFTLPVAGWSPGGGLEPAAGTTVKLTTVLDASGDVTTFEAEGVADAAGNVNVKLVPATASGNRTYFLAATPPPTAAYASLAGETLAVGTLGGTLEQKVLPPRVYVTGTVVSHDGAALENATVRAQPSYGFLLGLESSQRQALTQFAWPEVVTDRDGRFGIYLDPGVLGLATSYDLEIIPPASSLRPRWSMDELSLDPYADRTEPLDVGRVVLPDASYARGVVTDPSGGPVAEAEMRLYVVQDAPACAAKATDCQPLARLRSIAKSGPEGDLFLVLPAP